MHTKQQKQHNLHTLHTNQYLFVPATHIERVEKAFAKGADAVIIDLEDAVHDNQKSTAWQNVLDYLQTPQANPVWLRLNSQNNNFYAKDCQMLKAMQSQSDANQIKLIDKIQGFVLPKIETEDEIHQNFHQFNKPIIALIESPKAMANIANIATAKGLMALSFGFLDICEQLNVNANSQAGEMLLNQLRYQLLIHSKINDLQSPIEGVLPVFDDEIQIRQTISWWQDLGFSAMLCIHPNQVKIVNDMIKPSENQLNFAKQVIDYYEKTGLSAFAIAGEMVDTPVIKQAYRLLKLDN